LRLLIDKQTIEHHRLGYVFVSEHRASSAINNPPSLLLPQVRRGRPAFVSFFVHNIQIPSGSYQDSSNACISIRTLLPRGSVDRLGHPPSSFCQLTMRCLKEGGGTSMTTMANLLELPNHRCHGGGAPGRLE
jgi:hypothetical protein